MVTFIVDGPLRNPVITSCVYGGKDPMILLGLKNHPFGGAGFRNLPQYDLGDNYESLQYWKPYPPSSRLGNDTRSWHLLRKQSWHSENLMEIPWHAAIWSDLPIYRLSMVFFRCQVGFILWLATSIKVVYKSMWVVRQSQTISCIFSSSIPSIPPGKRGAKEASPTEH